MDSRTKIKTVVTIVFMALSLIALYAFIFLLDVSIGWRIVLVAIAVGWLIDGTIRLVGFMKRK